MKILIAEDDAVSRRILSALLEKSGHSAIVAENGKTAWEIMQRSDAPRIAIIDWIMPELDGVEVCEKIRSIKTDSPPYIIMLTIRGSKVDTIKGLESGANDYVSKPYDPGELRARVNAGKRLIDLQDKVKEQMSALAMREKKIEALLAEKELLLYEVHHRIKNNLNTVMNLLTLQADAAKTKSTSEALVSAASRMKAMSLLYDRLYRSDNISSMPIDKYVPPLMEEILSVFPDRFRVELFVEMPNDKLDAEKLSSLGIILNELAFNSMKYAFKGRQTGMISVTAYRKENEIYCEFEDDGIGLPKEINFEKSKTFGFTLVKGIARQMGGSIRLLPHSGTRYEIKFPINF